MTVEDQARAAVRAERRRLLRRHRARLAAAGLGRSRGGLTSKVHLAADRRRRPLAFVLTPGQAADSPRFEAVLERVRVRRPVGRPRTRPEAVAAAKVDRFVAAQPRLRLHYAARYSPQDNPVERLWAALVAYLANTAVDWHDRIHQARVFFRRRTPTDNLATAAPWSSPWLPPSYMQNFRQTA